ncbi:uncharacterized protein LOC132162632 [Corylus avellana]|uniref:uncharacterized protein LOC132162632 n=1 Tax=Corylus avellana TaxID=13451 RepID=UPI00286AD4B6|nr:uncharacterized protein LOC132162632 [Corylus avellana]
MQDEHNTGLSMTSLEADLNAVMNHGGVALLPEQLQLDWRIGKIFPRPHKNAIIFHSRDSWEVLTFNMKDTLPGCHHSQEGQQGTEAAPLPPTVAPLPPPLPPGAAGFQIS